MTEKIPVTENICGSSSGQSFLNLQSYVCESFRQDKALNGVVNVVQVESGVLVWKVWLGVEKSALNKVWLSRFVTSAYKQGYKWC